MYLILIIIIAYCFDANKSACLLASRHESEWATETCEQGSVTGPLVLLAVVIVSLSTQCMVALVHDQYDNVGWLSNRTLFVQEQNAIIIIY